MEIADRLGHPRLDLAGFSWGGALAQQITVQFTGCIRRLVLMATTPSVSAPGIGWAALFDNDMLASGLKLPTATPLGLAHQEAAKAGDRKRVVEGKRVQVSVGLGGSRIIKKKKQVT